MVCKIFWLASLLWLSVLGIDDCPLSISTSGIMSDIGLLSDYVSQQEGTVQGNCGRYETLFTMDAIYDTRMRLYKANDSLFILFRPTQQTSQGGDIHVDRRMVPCDFFQGCHGFVHQRFQEAFIRLTEGTDWDQFRGYQFYIGGHSLGGAFAIFMGVFLREKYQILPQILLGIAGPFIGDESFNQHYLVDLKKEMPDWWQMEDYNAQESDLTVEKYNVDGYPYISIYYPAVCKVYVDRLWDSYGMHDLRNYRQALQGQDCLH